MNTNNIIVNCIESAKHILRETSFWSLNEVADIIELKGELFEKVLFNAKQICAAKGINYAEHFCALPNDTLVTEFGLCRFLKAIDISPDTLPNTQDGVIMAKDFFEMYSPTYKFNGVDANANDFFLFPGDKVRILHEIGQSRGLVGATGVVQFHTFDTLSIIGPFQFFCKREDIQLIERKKR